MALKQHRPGGGVATQRACMLLSAWFESRPGLQIPDDQICAAPTLSAMTAPRVPSGFGRPTVVSCAV